MKNISEREFDLIISIVNRGFADLVIDASRKNGARGGTIFYARGTGIHELEKYFDVAIQPEKEVVLSIVAHSYTEKIMHGIIEAAGLKTEGRGLCFSLPVDNVMGISSWAKLDAEEAERLKKAYEESRKALELAGQKQEEQSGTSESGESSNPSAK